MHLHTLIFMQTLKSTQIKIKECSCPTHMEERNPDRQQRLIRNAAQA